MDVILYIFYMIALLSATAMIYFAITYILATIIIHKYENYQLNVLRYYLGEWSENTELTHNMLSYNITRTEEIFRIHTNTQHPVTGGLPTYKKIKKMWKEDKEVYLEYEIELKKYKLL